MTEQYNHCTLTINVTDNYKLQCLVTDSQGEDHLIKINDQQTEEYLPITIAFNMNEITVCQEQQNSIHFIKEWIEHPENYTKYQINYQNQQYSIISEVLFALIISQFKKRIEKEWIIDETLLHII